MLIASASYPFNYILIVSGESSRWNDLSGSCQLCWVRISRSSCVAVAELLLIQETSSLCHLRHCTCWDCNGHLDRQAVSAASHRHPDGAYSNRNVCRYGHWKRAELFQPNLRTGSDSGTWCSSNGTASAAGEIRFVQLLLWSSEPIMGRIRPVATCVLVPFHWMKDLHIDTRLASSGTVTSQTFLIPIVSSGSQSNPWASAYPSPAAV